MIRLGAATISRIVFIASVFSGNSVYIVAMRRMNHMCHNKPDCIEGLTELEVEETEEDNRPVIAATPRPMLP